MEYKNIDSQHILVRLDPNDEIVTSLMQVAKEEKIELAMVQGIGAVKKVVMGVYNVPEQHYKANTLEGAFEMLSLTGTMTRWRASPTATSTSPSATSRAQRTAATSTRPSSARRPRSSSRSSRAASTAARARKRA